MAQCGLTSLGHGPLCNRSRVASAEPCQALPLEQEDNTDDSGCICDECSSMLYGPSSSSSASSYLGTLSSSPTSTHNDDIMGRRHSHSHASQSAAAATTTSAVIAAPLSFAAPTTLPWSGKNSCSWSSSEYRHACRSPASSSTPTLDSMPASTAASTMTTASIKDLLHEAMQSSAITRSNPARLMAARAAAAAASADATLMSRSSSEVSTSSASSIDTDAILGSSDDEEELALDDESSEQEILNDHRFNARDCQHEEEEDETDEDEDEDSYSTASSDQETDPSSCPSSSTSLDSLSLPRDCFPRASASELALAAAAARASCSSSARRPSILPQRRRSTRIEGPYTFPAPTPLDELKSTDLEASLRFSALSGPSGTADDFAASAGDSAPPAFFPLQRVSFAPQLRVKTQGGVPLAMSGSKNTAPGIAGMMLGVTGMVEVLDAEKSRKQGREVVKTQRMIADFATDLTNGLRIWRRDASPIVKEKLKVERQWRAKHDMPAEDLDDPRWEEMLAPGTFMLPLSMKIPCSDKLPPSFESAHFRIRYTMSLAIFSSRKTADGKPEILHVHSLPFTILPSTLPTPAPQIPILTHDSRKSSFFAGITRALSLGGPAPNPKPTDKACTHIICPSIPTSSYSPGSVIPITLRIADCPTDPTDLYIRLSLIRKVYVRDSSYPCMNEWGLPEDLFFEEFCKEEEEIVSRWGYVPYAARAKQGATPGCKAQVIISDITLPVGGPSGEWNSGYSCALDLGPTNAPTMKHGECSWFSSALSKRPPAKAEYERFVHASTRHYVSIEIGFANDKLGDLLKEVGTSVPDMEIPQANTFTYPAGPTTSPICGLSTTNPFPASSTAAGRTKKPTSTAFQHAPQLPSFPGKLKEILIPVTIGSVAEPQLSCIINRESESQASVIPPSPPRSMPAATAEESADRAALDANESETERHERVGDDGEEPWLCPPPCYKTAVSSAPAYV